MAGDGVERRLAAILHADVVGYSRLMAEDEVATVRTLTAYRHEIEGLVGDHRGRLVDATGDDLLVEFPSASEAVRAAVEIQRVIAARNADLPEEHRMQFRVGVHLGEVMVGGARIYGDGVNIAARLQGLAEPGGIRISAAVYEQVGHKLPHRFDDLGEERLKNLPDPVHVYGVGIEQPPPALAPSSRRRPALAVVLVLVIGGSAAAGWFLLAGDRAREEPDAGEAIAPAEHRKAIAVLPFQNLSDDPENRFFAAGIQDDILSRLAKIRDLTVISRTSVQQYAGTEKDVRTIAKELGVGSILEGSVRRAPGQVRIVVQLIDARADAHLWSETYDRELTVANVFAIQSEIAEQVAEVLRAELTAGERERIASRPTDVAEAYDLYLQGKEYLYLGRLRVGGEDERLAVQMLERAVELDPRFALAHARLSRVHSWLYWANLDRSAERLGWAREAAARALALEPDLAEAHLAQGYYHYHGFRDYDRALEEFALAERGLPANAELLAAKGYIQRRRGQWEMALSHLERAAALDPRGAVHVPLAVTHRSLRRYAEAERYFDRALTVAPDASNAARLKAQLAFFRDGDIEPRRTWVESLAPGVDPDGVATFTRAWVAIIDGDYVAALDVLAGSDREHLGTGRPIPKAFLEGYALLRLGRTDEARAAFEAARLLLEAGIRERPDDADLQNALGQAVARLGRKEEAIRAGLRAVELLPISKDALVGPIYVLDLAWTYAAVGEPEAAVEQLERYLSVPAWYSIEGILAHPFTDPLRDHPAFQALVEKHRREAGD